MKKETIISSRTTKAELNKLKQIQASILYKKQTTLYCAKALGY